MTIAQQQPRVLADVVPHTWVRQALLVGGAAAFVGLCAQVAIPLPFTPVPLTLQTFAVLLSAAALGTWRSVAAMAVYVLAGALGVPWFAGHSSGVSAPSFGYLIGFVVAAMVVGRMAEKGSSRTPAGTALAMLVGSIVIYAIGASWLKVAIGCDWPTAISLGVTPFIVGDLLKLVFATALLPLSWSGLRRAGLLDEPDDRS